MGRVPREAVPAVLALIAFIGGAMGSKYFLDVRYLLDSSSLYIETGLLALGMTLVIVGGHIDLSVAAILALVACVTAKMLGTLPAAVVLPFGIAFGAFLGWINGILVARLRLPSFAVTLATMAAYRGAAQVLAGAESIKVPAPLVGIDFATIPGTPIPVPLTLFLGVAMVVGLLRHRTVLGRWIASIGTNERAAFYSGVPTQRVTTTVFALSGALAGLAALVIESRLGVARYDHARGMEVDAITAVVLGGASISGGVGSILGTCLALLLIALLRTGMGVANVTAEYQLAVIGVLLVLAVLPTVRASRLGSR